MMIQYSSEYPVLTESVYFDLPKLLLILLIAMKSGNALDLPLSGISLNTSIVLDCMI